jgi:hypothetical protein
MPIPASLDPAQAIAHAIAERDSKIPAKFLLPLKTKAALLLNVADVRSSSGLLSPRELEITALDATSLRDAIAARAYTAVEVARAFVGATAIAQQTTNCLVDLFADEALEQAAGLDAFLLKEGRTVGPLHGVPISVKVSEPLKLLSRGALRLMLRPGIIYRTTSTSKGSIRPADCSPTSARASRPKTPTASEIYEQLERFSTPVRLY